MKVLVGCEFSGRVRNAFLKRGHDAVSCDFLSSERVGPHIKGNILNHLDEGWDLATFFPPCTYLAVSGAGWDYRTGRAELRQRAVDFVFALRDAPIPRIAIENPIGRLSTLWRKPDQIIQPWMFGHDESKKTCLWLKNLPLLKPTKIVESHVIQRASNLTPAYYRGIERSRTYEGIAEAMAEQWGSL